MYFNSSLLNNLDDLPDTDEGSVPHRRSEEVVKIYDNMFVLRVVLNVVMGLIALIVGAYTLFKQCCEQKYAEPVGRSKLIG